MKQVSFDGLMEWLSKKCDKVMSLRGFHYIGKDEEDRLANFKQIAERSSSTPLEVWQILLNKPLLVLSNWTKGEIPISREDFDDRFVDAINYLRLGYALMLEEKFIGTAGPIISVAEIDPNSIELINDEPIIPTNKERGVSKTEEESDHIASEIPLTKKEKLTVPNIKISWIKNTCYITEKEDTILIIAVFPEKLQVFSEKQQSIKYFDLYGFEANCNKLESYKPDQISERIRDDSGIQRVANLTEQYKKVYQSHS